jgi:signal transduction histidine kinase
MGRRLPVVTAADALIYIGGSWETKNATDVRRLFGLFSLGDGRMHKKGKIENFQDKLRQTNERLLLSAFNAHDDANRANEALVFLQEVLGQMPGGVIITDPATGEITLSNQKAQRLWPGCTSISDMARHFETTCFHTDGTLCRADELPLYRSIRARRRLASEQIRFRRGDGSSGTMSVDCTIVRNRNGDVIANVLTCEDMTDQQAAAEREQGVLLQLRELSAKLESAREEERTRIARELHDELGQSLTALHLDLTWLLKATRRDMAVVRPRIQAMIEATKQTILSMRQLASDLRPSILDNFGLIPAIEWQLSEFQKRTRIRARLHCEGDRAIDRESSTVVFRIVQEALTNVIRHAEATRVNVNLKIDDHFLMLEVNDNGRDIRSAEIACSESLGIVGMQERVKRLGGEFKIVPRSPRGTRLDVSIPLGVMEPIPND